MRIATTLTGTVLAAACLFGLSGLSSVANAAEPTAGPSSPPPTRTSRPPATQTARLPSRLYPLLK